ADGGAARRAPPAGGVAARRGAGGRADAPREPAPRHPPLLARRAEAGAAPGAAAGGAPDERVGVAAGRPQLHRDRHARLGHRVHRGVPDAAVRRARPRGTRPRDRGRHRHGTPRARGGEPRPRRADALAESPAGPGIRPGPRRPRPRARAAHPAADPAAGQAQGPGDRRPPRRQARRPGAAAHRGRGERRQDAGRHAPHGPPPPAHPRRGGPRLAAPPEPDAAARTPPAALPPDRREAGADEDRLTPRPADHPRRADHRATGLSRAGVDPARPTAEPPSVPEPRPRHRGRPGGPGRQRGRKVFATFRKASFSSGAPIETRAPSPANGRTLTPCASHAAENSIVRSPRRSHTKLASVGGTVQPSARRAPRTRSRSFTVPSTRSSSSSVAASDATPAACATEFTLNGRNVLRIASATTGCATRYPMRRPAS